MNTLSFLSSFFKTQPVQEESSNSDEDKVSDLTSSIAEPLLINELPKEEAHLPLENNNSNLHPIAVKAQEISKSSLSQESPSPHPIDPNRLSSFDPLLGEKDSVEGNNTKLIEALSEEKEVAKEQPTSWTEWLSNRFWGTANSTTTNEPLDTHRVVVLSSSSDSEEFYSIDSDEFFDLDSDSEEVDALDSKNLAIGEDQTPQINKVPIENGFPNTQTTENTQKISLSHLSKDPSSPSNSIDPTRLSSLNSQPLASLKEPNESKEEESVDENPTETKDEIPSEEKKEAQPTGGRLANGIWGTFGAFKSMVGYMFGANSSTTNRPLDRDRVDVLSLSSDSEEYVDELDAENLSIDEDQPQIELAVEMDVTANSQTTKNTQKISLPHLSKESPSSPRPIDPARLSSLNGQSLNSLEEPNESKEKEGIDSEVLSDKTEQPGWWAWLADNAKTVASTVSNNIWGASPSSTKEPLDPDRVAPLPLGGVQESLDPNSADIPPTNGNAISTSEHQPSRWTSFVSGLSDAASIANQWGGALFQDVKDGAKIVGNAGLNAGLVVAADLIASELSNYNQKEVVLEDDVKAVMKQLDPQGELREKCGQFVEAAVPIAAEKFFPNYATANIKTGLAGYLGKMSYKVLACLAAHSFNKKNVKLELLDKEIEKNESNKIDLEKDELSLNSIPLEEIAPEDLLEETPPALLEEFLEEGQNLKFHPEKSRAFLNNETEDFELKRIQLDTGEVAYEIAPSSKKESPEQNEDLKLDVFDYATQTVLDLAQKHLGSADLLQKNIKNYVHLPEDTQEAKDYKASERIKLLECINPIMDEVLSICGFTSINSLELGDRLTSFISTVVNYKKGEQSEWEYIKNTIKELLFDRYCSSLLAPDPEEHVDNVNVPASEPVIPDALLDIGQRFLQGALESEIKKAKMPLSLSDSMYKKLRTKVDRKNRLPHFCHRIATAGTSKIMDKIRGSLAPYCNDVTISYLEQFLSLYIEKVMHKALAHLATSPATNTLPQQDLWLNVMTSLIDVANKHYGLIKAFESKVEFTESLKEVIAKYDALPEETEEQKAVKASAYKEICKKCDPIVNDLLQVCGLKDIPDLQLSDAVNNLIKAAALAGKGEDAWDLLRETLQWGLFELVRMSPELEKPMDKNEPDLSSIAVVGAKVGGPAILHSLTGVTGAIGDAIEALLEYYGWNIVDARSMEKIFLALFEGKSPVFAKFQEQLGDFLSPRAFAILKQASSYTPEKGSEDHKHQQVGNVLAKVIANACEVMRRNIEGRETKLQNAVKSYERQYILQNCLYAAKRHFDRMQKCLLVQQLISQPLPEDKKGKDLTSDPQYEVAKANEQANIQCMRILEAAECADKIPELAMAARAFFGEIDNSDDDIEVIKKFLFGNNSLNDIDKLLEECQKKYAFVEENANRFLIENFTDLAEEALALTGLNNDELTQVPGLAFLLNPKRSTAMQWLMLKAYYEIAAPLYVTGYHEQLEETLFGPPKAPLDPLLELMTSQPENPGLQEAYNEDQKAKKAVAFFDDTCSAFAKDIRDSLQQYMQTDAEEVASLINYAADDKFTPEAAAILKEGVQELAQTKNPAVKGAFDYTEKLMQGMLFRSLVKIGKTHISKTKAPVSNKEMMSAILIQVCGFFEDHKETLSLSMEAWHKLPNETKEDKIIRLKAIREIFKGAGNDLLSLLGPDPLKDMVPPSMEKSLEKALREKLLPSLMGKMYCKMTTFMREKKINQERLQLLYRNPENPKKGSTVPQEAMRAVAEFAVQAGTSYLALNSDTSAKKVTSSLVKHLLKTGPAGQRAANYLMAHAEEADKLLGDNINKFAMSKKQLQPTWDSAKEFVESILLQALGNVSGEFAILEDGKSELLQSITLQLLKLSAIHVTQLDRVRKDHDKTYIYEVDSLDLLKGQARLSGTQSGNPAFDQEYLDAKEELDKAQKELQELKDNKVSLLKKLKSHLGAFLGEGFKRNLRDKIKDIEKSFAPAIAKCNEAQQKFDDVRKKSCFVPIAHDLLALMNFKSAEDLPPQNQQFWDLLRNQILPAALQNIYDTMLDKNVLDSMIISALQALDAAASDTSPAKEEIERSDEQKAFDKELGETVVLFIKMMPEMLAKSFLKIEAINKMAVDTIGQKMRMALSEQTLLKIMHKGLFAGMESLVPDGKWVDINGEHILTQNSNTKIDFAMPMTAEEKKQADKRRAVEAEANAEKVHKVIGETAHKYISNMISDWVKSTWDKFQDAFDRSIEENCGGVDGWGIQIKRFFDMIFRTIFIEIIGTILTYVLWPIYKLIDVIADAIFKAFGKRTQKSVHAGINDALAYGLSNNFLQTMLKRKTEREEAFERIAQENLAQNNVG